MSVDLSKSVVLKCRVNPASQANVTWQIQPTGAKVICVANCSITPGKLSLITTICTREEHAQNIETIHQCNLISVVVIIMYVGYKSMNVSTGDFSYSMLFCTSAYS